MEEKHWFKVSSERMDKVGVELTTYSFQGDLFIHLTTDASSAYGMVIFIL